MSRIVSAALLRSSRGIGRIGGRDLIAAAALGGVERGIGGTDEMRARAGGPISLLSAPPSLWRLRFVRAKARHRPSAMRATACYSLPLAGRLSFITGAFFGAGAMVLAVRELRALHDPATNWLQNHIADTMGAYILKCLR